MIGFLTIAIGQTAGAPLFGFLMDRLTPDVAVMMFACLAFTAGLATPYSNLHRRPLCGRMQCHSQMLKILTRIYI